VFMFSNATNQDSKLRRGQQKSGDDATQQGGRTAYDMLFLFENAGMLPFLANSKAWQIVYT
jgi:hypothetical protein